jgi:DNA-binding response OmpR family regulator
MKQILLFDRALLIRMRIKEALATSSVKIHEVESESEVFNILQKLKGGVDLIIMDVALDSSNGFEVVRKIKEIDHNVPIVILTSSNKRADFIKGIQAGASDYILKPFEDDFFKARIFSVMEHEQIGHDVDIALHRVEKQTHLPIITESMPVKKTEEARPEESFRELLKVEKYKAKKGKYPLSVFALIFETPDDRDELFSEKHFSDIRAQLWESDEFVYYGPHSFYGILPFCHEAGFERFKEKMQVYLNEEAEEREFYHRYLWHVVGITLSSEEYEDLEIEQIVELLKLEIARQIKEEHSQ